MINSLNDRIMLNNGTAIPGLGLGVFSNSRCRYGSSSCKWNQKWLPFNRHSTDLRK